MKTVVKVLIGLVCLGVVVCGSILCYILVNEKKSDDMTLGDVIIVPGAQVKADGTLSLQLEWRLNQALEAYQAKPRRIICCGAQGSNEPDCEGTVMRNWLIGQGIPADMVLAENASLNTWQNLKNAAAMLSETEKSVLLITSDYHLPRTRLIAEDLGLTAYGVGAPVKSEYWLKNHGREILAMGKYIVWKVLGLEG